jgi:hypothetical protein
MKLKTDLWCFDDLFEIERGPIRFFEEEVEFVSSLKGEKRHPEIGKAISEGRKGIVFSEEHKRNLSLSHRGKTHPISEETKRKIGNANRGKRRSPSEKEFISQKTREVMKSLNQQTYLFTSPTGESFSETTTLSEFARKHNLNKSLLSLVLNGKRKHTKGWKVVLHNPVEN